MHELFISYCRHDSDAANALADMLSKAGLSVWLDRKGIQEGAAFDTQIERPISQTRVVIVIWSEHSVKSHWVRAEAAYCARQAQAVADLDRSIRAASAVHADSNDRLPLPGIAPATTMHFNNSPVRWRAIEASAASNRRPAPLRVAHVGGPERRRGRASGQDKTAGMDCRGGSSLPETVVEKEYQDYFCEKTFIIAQFAMLLATVTYLVYGGADMAMESGGVLSTRFRFMIALPLMATFFALSSDPSRGDTRRLSSSPSASWQ